MRTIPVILVVLLASFANAEPIDMVSFNLESGGADVDRLSAQIRDIEDIDIWAFSEVDTNWPDELEEAAQDDGANFEKVLSDEGAADRLLIVFNADRFKLVGSEELHDINPGRRVRSPLVVHLRDCS